jgi:DNA-binding GntR family transcriptional regulator
MDTGIPDPSGKLVNLGFVLDPADGSIGNSIAQAVAASLRTKVFDGTLRPGGRLRQEELAEALGVSRQPVREALQRLIAEGLLVKQPDRSVAVRQFSSEAIKENYILRAALESTAARFAAQNRTQLQLIAMRAAHVAMNRAVTEEDSALTIEFNAQLHRLIHQGSHMPILISLINQLWIGLTVFTPLFVPGRSERSNLEHEAVISAIATRDGELAETAMRAHVEAAAEDYFNYQAKRALSQPAGEVG